MHLKFQFFGVAQQKMEQEIKEREEKYSELETKLSRLHKRAKQRIQEVQKVCHAFTYPLLIVWSLDKSLLVLELLSFGLDNRMNVTVCQFF